MRYLKQKPSGYLFGWSPELAARSDMVEVLDPEDPLPRDPLADVLSIRPGAAYDADEPAKVDTSEPEPEPESESEPDSAMAPVAQPVRRRRRPADGGVVAAVLAPIPAPVPALEVDTSGDGF